MGNRPAPSGPSKATGGQQAGDGETKVEYEEPPHIAEGEPSGGGGSQPANPYRGRQGVRKQGLKRDLAEQKPAAEALQPERSEQQQDLTYKFHTVSPGASDKRGARYRQPLPCASGTGLQHAPKAMASLAPGARRRAGQETQNPSG